MCDTVYYHRYYPTVFDPINNPWYQGNQCPFARTNPITWPPTIGTFTTAIKPNPTEGTYGTCTQGCQVGTFPVTRQDKCECADIYGNVGTDPNKLVRTADWFPIH
jgi:hypothetical protein